MSHTVITAVSLTHATVDDDRQVPWETLIAAAQQDRQTNERDHRGMRLRPNGDTVLANKYRQILAGCLERVRQAGRAAYDDYCRHGMTTRSTINATGHGSWVSGPCPDAQARWRQWDKLAKAIEAAISE